MSHIAWFTAAICPFERSTTTPSRIAASTVSEISRSAPGLGVGPISGLEASDSGWVRGMDPSIDRGGAEARHPSVPESIGFRRAGGFPQSVDYRGARAIHASCAARVTCSRRMNAPVLPSVVTVPRISDGVTTWPRP